MKNMSFYVAIVYTLFSSSIISAETLLFDEFDSASINPEKWHIPTWMSPRDGTFIGRTQFRCTQNSSLPITYGGNSIITMDSYNPTGFSFYGTDLISNKPFASDKELRITVRAKMNSTTPGLVGGIFLYALKSGSSTLHDEIDFEFLTNRPNEVQTNIYGNEPLGIGHPQFTSYPSGRITDYHTYEIRCTSTSVSWIVDGNVIRTDTSHVPSGAMYFHLNIWAPGSEWPEAYSASLQPASSASANQTFSMSVDSVTIASVEPTPKSFLLFSLPFLYKK